MSFVQRWRAAGLIVPTIFTVALLPILIGLGTWQWHRLAWKEDLIAKVTARAAALPTTYGAALQQAEDLKRAEYLRVTVRGRFDPATERLVYAPTRQGQGWNVYTLLTPAPTDAALPPVFVNRGWVPDAKRDAATRSEGQPKDVVEVTGLLRGPEATGMFTPDNDVADNRWFSRDLAGMTASLAGAAGGSTTAAAPPRVAPFFIDAEALPENPGGWPKGGTTEVRLSNPHLQYVVTWYGVALTLLGVFAAYARQRLQALNDAPPTA